MRQLRLVLSLVGSPKPRVLTQTRQSRQSAEFCTFLDLRVVVFLRVVGCGLRVFDRAGVAVGAG